MRLKSLNVIMMYAAVSAIPSKIEWPSTIPRKSSKQARTRHVFQEFYDSQELCKRFYAPWWAGYLSLRRMTNLKTLFGLKNPDILDGVPDLPLYFLSPVQSIGAVVGGRRNSDAERTNVSRSCSTVCEDVRSDLELLISGILNVRQHVRYTTSFYMKCPDNYVPEIELFKDDREAPSPELTALFKSILKSFYAKLVVPPESVAKFDSYQQDGPRVIGKPVKRCVCKNRFKNGKRAWVRSEAFDVLMAQKKASADDVPELDASTDPTDPNESQPIDIDLDEELDQLLRVDVPDTLPWFDNDQYLNDNIYREGALELQSAVMLWIEQYPS